MKVEDLEFKTVGCCEVHVQAEVEVNGIHLHITPVEGLFNVTVLDDNGLKDRFVLVDSTALQTIIDSYKGDK